jgi:hypothetical protein
MSTLSTTNLKNPSSGSNNIVLNADGTTTVAAPSNIIKSGIAVASTSGVAIDFTGIPSWAKRVTVMFNGVSLSATSDLLIQLGTSSGIESTSYASSCSSLAATVNTVSSTTGFIITAGAAAMVQSGHLIITNISGSIWIESHATARTDSAATRLGGGTKTLSGTLDRVRITTVNGTDTFDAGSINILYEG